MPVSLPHSHSSTPSVSSLGGPAPTIPLHRVRFVDYMPSPITALALPPSPSSSPFAVSSAARLASRSHNVHTSLKSDTDAQALARHRPILAVGRDNGNIDICVWVDGGDERASLNGDGGVAAFARKGGALPKGWMVERIFPAPHPSKVDSLAFTWSDTEPGMLRLFSSGGGSELFEWDMERGTIKRTIGSLGGAIWAISPSPLSATLAIGCEDGHVRLLSLEGGDLHHLGRLDRVNSRVLSLSWGPPRLLKAGSHKVPVTSRMRTDSDESDSSADEEDEDDKWEDTFILGGCADSSARQWDVHTGRVVERLTMDKLRNEATLVWACSVLGDGTMVTGDSLGHVKFWDALTGTLLQSFPVHAADVLCLTVGSDGRSVYSSGVDQKTVEFALVGRNAAKAVATNDVASSKGIVGKEKWIVSASRRLHSHDVRALVMDPPFSLFDAAVRRNVPAGERTLFSPPSRLPVLISGGLDMSLVLCPASSPSSISLKAHNPISSTPLTAFADTVQRRVPFVPSSARGSAKVVDLCKAKRWVVVRRDSGIGIWRVEDQNAGDRLLHGASNGALSDEATGWSKLLDMELKTRTNITATAISPDGRWLAVSDQYETKLYRLDEEVAMGGRLKPRRLKSFSAVLSAATKSTGSSCLTFSPDSARLVLCLTATAYVLIVELPTAPSEAVTETNGRTCRVLRAFGHHCVRRPQAERGTRAIAGRKSPNGVVANGEPMGSPDTNTAEREGDEDENDVDEDGDDDEEGEVVTQICCASISPDGQWLATADLRRRVHVFNLDSLQHHLTLPSPPYPPSTLAFHPAFPQLLTLGLPTNTVQIYDLEAARSSSSAAGSESWIRRTSECVKRRLESVREGLVGIVWVPASSARPSGGPTPTPTPTPTADRAGDAMILWGPTWMCSVRFETPVSEALGLASVGGGGGRKRRSGKRRRESSSLTTVSRSSSLATDADDTGSSVTVMEDGSVVDVEVDMAVRLTFKYQPLLLVDILPATASVTGGGGVGRDELIVVERPFFALTRHLPPAFYKGGKYGT